MKPAASRRFRRRTARRERPARWRRGPGRRRSPPATPAVALPELVEATWNHRGAELLATTFLAMVRRLPVLIGRALGIGWRASPVDMAAVGILNVTAGILTAFGVLATRGVFQALFAAGPTADRVADAVPSLVVVGATVAVRSGLQIGAGWAQSRLEPKVRQFVEGTLYDLATSVELAAFDDDGFADELERARARGSQSTQWLVTHTTDLLTALVGLAGASAALVVVHPLLVLVLVVAVLPRGWASIRSARIEYDDMYRRSARRRRLAMLGWLMANRRTAAELRAYTMRGFLVGEFDRVMTAETESDLDVARRQAVARLVGGTLGGIATGGVYAVLALLLTSHALPLSAAGTAVVALQAAQPALGQVVYQTNYLYEEGLYFGDYAAFCERARDRIDRTGRMPAPARFERIDLREVTLRYAGQGPAGGAGSAAANGDRRPAVDRVSLTLRRGETVALVGENGSGKTSLAAVLAGLYRPTSGTITWDGLDLAAVDADSLRERVAFVTQDYHRWPFTARENVRIGRHTRDDADEPVWAAARAGGAHDMILGLRFGYDTLLDRSFRDGEELSGGQWQRIAAARAFYRDAPLLICDEPSAALDARAEHALFSQLRSYGAGRTIVLITHRLANVRHADRIYVLDRGRLVEQGTHDELMAAGGRYAELFTLQSAGYLA